MSNETVKKEESDLKISAKNLKKTKSYIRIKTKIKKSLWTKCIEETSSYKNSLNKNAFIQNKRCTEYSQSDELGVITNLCRDCYLSDKSQVEEEECRFIGWRKLKLNSNYEYEEVGFLSVKEATEHDCSLWELDTSLVNKNYLNDIKILKHIADTFIKLIQTELNWRESFKNSLVWKRQMKNTREMCDQCSTSIFNGHLACPKCGFSVCFDCYNLRTRNLKLNKGTKQNNQDELNWYYCLYIDFETQSKRKKDHKPEDLIYVQFIPPHILNMIFFECNKFIDSNKIPLIDLKSTKKNQKNFSWSGQKFNEFLVLNSSNVENDTQQTPGDDLFEMFDKEWPNKRPIIIKNLHKNLNSSLWTPESFMEEFGDLKLNLINCRKNRVVPNVALRAFWQGFENLDARLCDQKGRPMILKLKDWPTSDDFKTTLPSRYEDLMKNLPIKEYTHRTGAYNLASNLPNFFCLPDLGPKLYIAYSSANTPKEGTTNLHVDISDAVNLMLYVGETNKSSQSEEPDSNPPKKIKSNVCLNSSISQEMFATIKESKCSKDQLERFLNGEKPGALWHIFKPHDADKIRTFLLLNEIKKGKNIINENDPIHDQIQYIDNEMLKALREECEVDVFTIIQFLGDAVFIPAGAPHQVRNLNSCIKVAGDFVAPQGIDQCLIITDQFRNLSERHSNHQDKLQVFIKEDNL